MKLAAIFALNALIVGAGILTYDVIRSDQSPAAVPAAIETADLSPVLDRIDALERRLDGIDTTSDRRVSTRLLQLEQHVSSLDADGAAAVDATLAEDSRVETAALAPADHGSDLGDGPVEEREVARVREALEQVEAERNRERAGHMANALVDRLGLSLTDEQSERLATELGNFRETMRDHFRSSIAGGVPRDEIRAGMEELRGELTETLGTFLAASDAEAIAAEIGNRGPGGGPGGGFGGGGRGN